MLLASVSTFGLITFLQKQHSPKYTFLAVHVSFCVERKQFLMYTSFLEYVHVCIPFRFARVLLSCTVYVHVTTVIIVVGVVFFCMGTHHRVVTGSDCKCPICENHQHDHVMEEWPGLSSHHLLLSS